MMKKITYILGLFSMLTFQSCLDMEPKTQLADTNYWQTPDHFKLFATQFYGWTVDFKKLDDSLIVMFVLILRTGITLDVYSNGTNSIPSSDKTYTNNYNRIRQVNTLLQQAEGYAAPADIETSVGEAHFFRAYCYFDLLQVYGDVIITRTPLDIDSPEMQMPVTLAMRWLILFWKIWKKQSDFFLKQMRLAVKMKVVCLVRLRVLFFLVSLFMKVLGKSFVMVDRTMIVQAHYWI